MASADIMCVGPKSVREKFTGTIRQEMVHKVINFFLFNTKFFSLALCKYSHTPTNTGPLLLSLQLGINPQLLASVGGRCHTTGLPVDWLQYEVCSLEFLEVTKRHMQIVIWFLLTSLISMVVIMWLCGISYCFSVDKKSCNFVNYLVDRS